MFLEKLDSTPNAMKTNAFLCFMYSMPLYQSGSTFSPLLLPFLLSINVRKNYTNIDRFLRSDILMICCCGVNG